MDILALCKAVAYLNYLVLAHAVHQQVGAAVLQNGGADCVVPVIIVGKPPERCFQTAQRHGHIIAVNSLYRLGIHYSRTVGALACSSACGVCVIGALFLCGGVMSHHGVDVARSYEKGVLGSAELCEIPVAVPVGLSNDTHSKALILYHSGDYGNSE